MRKEELRRLRRLYATPDMMRKAGMDVPVLKDRKNRWRKDLYEYKYGVYMRCQVLQGILKVAFFLTEPMRMGSNRPAYELYINRETGEFATWDMRLEKWRTAKVDMLDWPEYAWNSGRYINPEGNRAIKRYLNTEHGGYKGILEWQQSVRKEELRKKHKRETEPWDLDMDQIPGLPKDWERWVDKHAVTQNYIFYSYSRKGAEKGYCSWCEKDVPISRPRHNQYGTCRCCGRKVQYKARGKTGRLRTEDRHAYLIQRCEEGFVIREFLCGRNYEKGKYESPHLTASEIRRVIYSRGLHRKAYYYGLYRNDYHRWIKEPEYGSKAWDGGYHNYIYYESYEGEVYRRTLPSLAREELKRTGLPEIIRSVGRVDPEGYMEKLRRHPQYEQFAKAGLGRLVIDDIKEGESEFEKCREKDMAKALRIDKARMKRLRENRGGMRFLRWLQYEKEKDTIYPDEMIRFFEESRIVPADLAEMRTRMSEKRIFNYLRRQSRLCGRNPKELIQTWEDYICMVNRLKMDTRIEAIYRPKNLKKAHDEAVQLSGGGEIAKRAGKIAEAFPDIERIYEDIREKYEYEGGKYCIIVPERIEDIIHEGRILGHCLDRSDIYFERIQKRESYIVFLRLTQEPDKPYYTLEIEPGGAARQKRTYGDNQNKDFEEAKAFIRSWQQEVQKRLTEEDERMAEESRKLRMEEFRELRKEKKKIWHGRLAGRLLADVLEEDLMEVERIAAG